MGKVVVGMTVSLDGFVNDRNGEVSRLYPDLAALRKTKMLHESIRTTGAVLMGRRAYEMGDPDSYDWDDYEFQVPIFVLTHRVPEKIPRENGKLTFTFVTDGVQSAIAKAKRAAGNKNVTVVGGASTFQQCVNAGLCDEMQIGVMPVLLGNGLRLFENIDTEHIELQKLRILESDSGRTDILFQIVNFVK
jgi:dihydrofolate reductase